MARLWKNRQREPSQANLKTEKQNISKASYSFQDKDKEKSFIL